MIPDFPYNTYILSIEQPPDTIRTRLHVYVTVIFLVHLMDNLGYVPRVVGNPSFLGDPPWIRGSEQSVPGSDAPPLPTPSWTVAPLLSPEIPSEGCCCGGGMALPCGPVAVRWHSGVPVLASRCPPAGHTGAKTDYDINTAVVLKIGTDVITTFSFAAACNNKGKHSYDPRMESALLVHTHHMILGIDPSLCWISYGNVRYMISKYRSFDI